MFFFYLVAKLNVSVISFQQVKTCPILAKCGPMQIGDLIEVVGRVHSLPHSFYINLQAGFHSVPHPIISYHLVARYSRWKLIC